MKEGSPDLAEALLSDFDKTMLALGDIRTAAEAGTSYDQLIGAGNASGEALVQGAIDMLVSQTRNIERAVALVGLDGVAVEGSDSLDNPTAVFNRGRQC